MEIKAKEITLFPTTKLSEYPKNANDHTEEQIDEIIKLIEFYGHRDPLIVDLDIQPDGTHWVMAGNGRLQAAKKAGWDNLPIIFQKFNSEEEKYGFMVSHNAVSSNGWGGGLDLAKINMDIIDLGPDFDVKMLGIKDFVIEPIEKFEPKTDEDEVPEVVYPITRRGDIWLLENHRLMCGDSTMIDDVEKLMNGARANICFTSPPYNAKATYSEGQKLNGKLPQDKYIKCKDSMNDEQYTDFIRTNISMLMIYSKEVFYNIQFSTNTKKQLLTVTLELCEYLKDIIYWVKDNAPPNIQPSVMTNRVEYIYCFSKDDGSRKFRNIKPKQGILTNLITGSNASGNEFSKIHKATFPLYLPEKIINDFSEENQSVLDTFMGTGTTLIACEKTNRKCYGMELDEKYCDVIINRWQNFTGKKAVLESTKQTYEELKLEREN